VRFIGLDVHKDFCEVAVLENGKFRSGPKVPTRPQDLEAFAHSLAPDDEVALEATGGAFAVARILEPYVRRVVVANPTAVRAIAWAMVKTDRLDARTLAKLLAAGFLPGVWPQQPHPEPEQGTILGQGGASFPLDLLVKRQDASPSAFGVGLSQVSLTRGCDRLGHAAGLAVGGGEGQAFGDPRLAPTLYDRGVESPGLQHQLGYLAAVGRAAVDHHRLLGVQPLRPAVQELLERDVDRPLDAALVPLVRLTDVKELHLVPPLVRILRRDVPDHLPPMVAGL
jgi:hypothetical protein